MAEEVREVPLPPQGLDERAQGFWTRAVEEFDLTDSELEVLRELVFMMDELEDLRAALERDGVTVLGSTGQPRVNPAVNEVRQHRLALARLFKVLDLGAENAPPETQTTRDARAAANARWSMQRQRDAAPIDDVRDRFKVRAK